MSSLINPGVDAEGLNLERLSSALEKASRGNNHLFVKTNERGIIDVAVGTKENWFNKCFSNKKLKNQGFVNLRDNRENRTKLLEQVDDLFTKMMQTDHQKASEVHLADHFEEFGKRISKGLTGEQIDKAMSTNSNFLKFLLPSPSIPAGKDPALIIHRPENPVRGDFNSHFQFQKLIIQNVLVSAQARKEEEKKLEETLSIARPPKRKASEEQAPEAAPNPVVTQEPSKSAPARMINVGEMHDLDFRNFVQEKLAALKEIVGGRTEEMRAKGVDQGDISAILSKIPEYDPNIEILTIPSKQELEEAIQEAITNAPAKAAAKKAAEQTAQAQAETTRHILRLAVESATPCRSIVGPDSGIRTISPLDEVIALVSGLKNKATNKERDNIKNKIKAVNLLMEKNKLTLGKDQVNNLSSAVGDARAAGFFSKFLRTSETLTQLDHLLNIMRRKLA